MTILLCVLSAWIGLMGVVAALAKKFKTSTLALWLGGMGLGVLYLVLGSEMLAITQWFFATTTTLVIFTYALVMGDELRQSAPRIPRMQWREWILPLCGASSFAGILAIGLHDFEQWTFDISREPISVAQFGAQLVSHHPMVLLVLGFEILLTLIGAGVISRPDWVSENGEAAK